MATSPLSRLLHSFNKDGSRRLDLSMALDKLRPGLRRLFHYLFLTSPGSIILGSLIIALAILAGSGAIRTGGSSQTTIAGTTGTQTAPVGTTGGPVNVEVGNFPVRGNSDAKVTVIEFADFRCPFCERLFTDTISQMVKDYVDTGKIRFAFRNYAFLGQQSTWAAEAAECANEQGKFWDFHNWLYQNQAPESNLDYYSKANLAKYAATVGVNISQFTDCLNSDKYAQAVQADLAAGQKAGVSGTPTVFVNGTPVVGAEPYSTFKAIIEQDLKQ